MLSRSALHHFPRPGVRGIRVIGVRGGRMIASCPLVVADEPRIHHPGAETAIMQGGGTPRRVRGRR